MVLDPGDWILKEIVPPPIPEASVDPAYVEPGSEGIQITVDFSSALPISVTEALAQIIRTDSTVVDSFFLHDDGNHGDGDPGDGTWGGFGSVGPGEFTYMVDVFAVDSLGIEYGYLDAARFTTIGRWSTRGSFS